MQHTQTMSAGRQFLWASAITFAFLAGSLFVLNQVFWLASDTVTIFDDAREALPLLAGSIAGALVLASVHRWQAGYAENHRRQVIATRTGRSLHFIEKRTDRLGDDPLSLLIGKLSKNASWIWGYLLAFTLVFLVMTSAVGTPTLIGWERTLEGMKITFQITMDLAIFTAVFGAWPQIASTSRRAAA